jgi:hypothetical protein
MAEPSAPGNSHSPSLFGWRLVIDPLLFHSRLALTVAVPELGSLCATRNLESKNNREVQANDDS